MDHLKKTYQLIGVVIRGNMYIHVYIYIERERAWGIDMCILNGISQEIYQWLFVFCGPCSPAPFLWGTSTGFREEKIRFGQGNIQVLNFLSITSWFTISLFSMDTSPCFAG